MDAKQIIAEVTRYIGDNSYQYAILIDGEWGCGKTYFIQHDLSYAINKMKENNSNPMILKYISLYGCKSISDVQEAIVWSLADEVKQYLAEHNSKIKRLFRTDKNKNKKDKDSKKINDNVLASTKKIINSALEKFIPEFKLYDVITDWMILKSCIFVFDDLERCDCPINELFGFINGLVEHENTKVILVANEEEISKKEIVNQKELQYLLAANDRIKWDDNTESGSARHKRQDSDKLSIGQLELRRKQLFSDEIYDSNYKKIREKLIGVTLKYTSDIDDIVEALINKSNFTEENKLLLIENMDYYCSVMDSYNHHNLRTFQFFLSKVHTLLNILNDILDPKYIGWVRQFIVEDCFRCSVEHKSNFQPPIDIFERIRYESILSSKYVRRYVETGELSVEGLKNDFGKLIKENVSNVVPDSDSAMQLYYHYHQHSQRWCEENIGNVLTKLKNNEYPQHIYIKILIVMQRLVDIGFKKEYLESIHAIMVDNVRKSECTSRFDEDELHPIYDSVFSAKIQEYVRILNNVIAEKESDDIEKSVVEILSEENWDVLLGEVVSKIKLKSYREISFFCKAPADDWISCIMNSEPEHISGFRIVLEEAYPTTMIRGCDVYDDIPVLKDIRDGIKVDNLSDLIKIEILKWLKDQIDKVIRIYRKPDVEQEPGEAKCTY